MCVLNICICVHMCTCVFRTQRLTSNVARFRGHRVVESLVSVLKNSLKEVSWRCAWEVQAVRSSVVDIKCVVWHLFTFRYKEDCHSFIIETMDTHIIYSSSCIVRRREGVFSVWGIWCPNFSFLGLIKLFYKKLGQEKKGGWLWTTQPFFYKLFQN